MVVHLHVRIPVRIYVVQFVKAHALELVKDVNHVPKHAVVYASQHVSRDVIHHVKMTVVKPVEMVVRAHARVAQEHVRDVEVPVLVNAMEIVKKTAPIIARVHVKKVAMRHVLTYAQINVVICVFRVVPPIA